MIPRQYLSRAVAVIISGATPSRIAAGFVLGMLIGLIPSPSIDLLISLALIVFDVNLAAAFPAMAVF
ncbi:MAG: hypothetical protein GF344_08225 [Chitinivibrionales bacterium]|nr:hypothetical protein [Chitinivibrionales bacterium]